MLDRARLALARLIAPPGGARSFYGASQRPRAQALGSLPRWDSASTQAASTLRGRARHTYANNPLVAGAVRGLITALTGDGDRPILPADPGRAADRWAAWAVSCGPDGESFAEIERQTAESAIVDGEALIHLGLGEDSRLTLSPISADRIDDSKSGNLPAGTSMISGIEIDRAGREIAYWIHPFDPGLVSGWRPSVRVPAESVLRVWRPPGAGAVRGHELACACALGGGPG